MMEGSARSECRLLAIPSGDAVVFDDFQVLPSARLLLAAGRRVPIGARAFDILLALVDDAGTVVSKEDLLKRVWPETLVEEGALRVHISALRKAIQDGLAGRRYIINDPGRGYCFTGHVSRVSIKKDVSTASIVNRRGGASFVRAGSCFGRGEIVNELTSCLALKRLVTVVGPGGIGKTTVALRIARECAESFSGGVLFVDLAPLTDSHLVAPAMASSLGLAVSGQDTRGDLARLLRDEHMLVILDNCEHVLMGAASLAETLTQETSQVSVLATSREALRAADETVHRLAPLEAPDDGLHLTPAAASKFPAYELFVRRAEERLETFQVAEHDVKLISTICRRLDGNALAIELAAARIDAVGLHGIAERLDDRFALLDHGRRTASPRHQALLSSFDWSFDALERPTQVLFRRLAVFPGFFSLEDACAVAEATDSPRSSIQSALGALCDTSLLSVVVEHAAIKYRFLESTRDYALRKLGSSSDARATPERLAHYCLLQLTSLGSALRMKAGSLDRLDAGPLLDNVRSAIRWCFSSPETLLLGVDLVIEAVPLWFNRLIFEECRHELERALGRLLEVSASEAAREMKLRSALGSVSLYSDAGSPVESWTASLRLAEELQDAPYQFDAVGGLFDCTLSAGRLKEAEALSTKYDALLNTCGGPSEVLAGQRLRAVLHFFRGEFDAAVEEAKAVVHNRADADFRQVIVASGVLAASLWHLGLTEQATSVSLGMLREAELARSSYGVIYVLAYSACRVAILNGDDETARRLTEQLMCDASADPRGQWLSLGRCWSASALLRTGDAAAAAAMFAEVIDTLPESSFAFHQTCFLGQYGFAQTLLGDGLRGLRNLSGAIASCNRSGEMWYLPELLRMRGEARCLEVNGEIPDAAKRDLIASMELARVQGALSFELRTATSIERLSRAEGGANKMQSGLRCVYDRFQEGLGSRDLQEARALLQLAS